LKYFIRLVRIGIAYCAEASAVSRKGAGFVDDIMGGKIVTKMSLDSAADALMRFSSLIS
jgi:hypothetical protein